MQALHHHHHHQHPFSYALNPGFVGAFPVIYACSSPAADASCSPAASPPVCCGRLPYPSECAAAGPRPNAPRPFTIEAILGLDAGQLTDAHTDKGRRPPPSKNGLKCRATSHPHRRITANGKECRRTFSDSGLHEISEKNTKSKRVRTIFTPEQLERLEVEFERQQYMVGQERLYLAATLNLTEAQVKVWFQNRRIKWRKQHLEMQQARLAKIREADGGDPQDAFAEDLAESSDEDIP